MRNVLFGVLLLAVIPSLASMAVPVADTPALQIFKLWLQAFNSGDQTKEAAFWKKYGTVASAPRADGDLQLHRMTGAMSIVRVKEDTGTHLVALMKEANGGYSESTLDLASTDPAVIAGMRGHRVPPPMESGPHAANDEELARRVHEHVAEKNGEDAFSGAALVAHNGKVVLDQAWGLADTEKGIPNTTATEFCIGSMNKMFTAVSILQLVQQGKLALDKPVVDYWPDYPNHDLAARVTIRELLNHTGGTGDIFTPEFDAHRQEIRTLADYVKLYGNRPVAFNPGSRMEYSNYGFILLGRIIELVSGESYDAYVQQHIYLPAGMSHTNAGPDIGYAADHHAAGVAVGYIRTPEGLKPNTDTYSRGSSAGGGFSTVHDLFQFATALQDGKLLDPALLKQATTASAARDDYGMGFYVLGNGAYGHGGGGPGINGELHILPKSGYVIAALVNRDPPMASDTVNWIGSILPRH
jgi:D-alanyl-D-alanine carboxypeptidase